MDLSVRKGVSVMCERVGVLAFHPRTRIANPWESHDLNRGLYPWEAISQFSP